ncbi:beta-1,3-galactosyltransferase 5-like [Periplaneta americana]|uniref:beta-1,3-galactosyltransferase 5-like n=1 Tax=Periplaneta americana TaxID=6978 RepID=UPI0037E847BD
MKLMAYQVRVFHPLVLAIMGMCLISYSSYYASTGLFQSTAPDRSRIYMMSHAVTPAESASSAGNTTVSSPATQGSPNTNTTVSAPVPPVVSVVTEALSNNATTQHVAFQQVIQKIPPKQPVATSNSSSNVTSSDRTEQGILTRCVYESGFNISNVELCPDLGSNMQLLIAITSAPSHKEARMAIRQTWGHFRQRSDVNIAFLLGSTKDAYLAQELINENKLYSDLISAHFLDSYNNLTLKTVSLLEWVDNYCNRVKFILKTDDDMFINIPKLLSFIEKHSKDKRTIFGRLAKRWKPIRNKKSKYYVSPNQYQPAIFPDFTTGPAYLITSDVIHDLYTAALAKTYLKLEDVFITGIVAQDMKIKRTHVNEFLNKRVTFNACNIQKGISIHMVKYHEQFDLWKKLLDGKSKCK